MGTISGALNIALGALAADRGAIAVTSNNIANVNTAGYSEEQVNLAENPDVKLGSHLFGTGVSQEQTTTLRDNLIELRLDQENQTAQQLSSYLGSANQVQTLFNETNGTGLQSALTAFFNSYTQLSADPTNSSYRQAVITAGQNLASDVQQDSSSLHTLQTNADLTVTNSVTQINQLTSQIAGLNVQISGQVGAGEDPGSLLDQRTLLVRQLAGLVNISEIAAGNDSLTVTTGSGASLVVAGQSFDLTAQTNLTIGLHDIYAQGTNITSGITGGLLGGTLQARDQLIPSVSNQLDTLSYGLATAVNTQSRAGFDTNGNAGVNFFTQPSRVPGAANALAVTITDPNLVAASSDGSAGSNGNSQALANLQNLNIVNGQTPVNYYANTIFQIGNNVSQATSQQTAVSLSQQQLQDQRGAVSGVSLDQEAINLVQYQSAYQAAANVVSIINQLVQTTISAFQAA